MNETGKAVSEIETERESWSGEGGKFVDPRAQCFIHHTSSLTYGHHHSNHKQKFGTSVSHLRH